tara:strand:+ start:12728 stop:12937 length:210 start_codon:yes stop_codon:yes gene_type:complete
MIEVFKTNITNKKTANDLLLELAKEIPNSRINFDLEDCDRILRIENCTIHTTEVIQILEQHGYKCELLE